jgi:superoxide reductase
MAVERLQVYKCETCGNIVEVVHGGKGSLVCCNKPMVRFVENTVDASKEKHVPVAEISDGKLQVKVGSVPHPMDEKHYIEWVEVIKGNEVDIRFLNPGDSPGALFNVQGDVTVRAYCNLHGLWKA